MSMFVIDRMCYRKMNWFLEDSHFWKKKKILVFKSLLKALHTLLFHCTRYWVNLWIVKSIIEDLSTDCVIRRCTGLVNYKTDPSVTFCGYIPRRCFLEISCVILILFSGQHISGGCYQEISCVVKTMCNG